MDLQLQPEPAREFPVYKKISGLRAALTCKCPRCRVGNMFSHGTWNIMKFSSMHRQCPHCKQDFKIEPGFYFGAAYVSYGMNAVLIVLCALFYFQVIPDFSLLGYIGILTLIVLLFLPLIFRLSRSIWLHLFGLVKFDPRYLTTVDVQKLMVRFRKDGKSVT